MSFTKFEPCDVVWNIQLKKRRYVHQ